MTSAGHLILIVEDEPQIRHFLRTTLTAEGYRVIEAETGERGVIEAEHMADEEPRIERRRIEARRREHAR